MNPISLTFFIAVTSFLPDLAHASECGDEIAKLQTFVKETKDGPFEGATEDQTVGAQLHHQPTPASIARAENEANGEVGSVLNKAKAFDTAHKETECMAELARAKMLLGLE